MFSQWLENKESENRNRQGGFEPKTGEQQKKWKKVDLITLPSDVKGTNCANCVAYIKKTDNKGYCTNPNVLEWVTPRMCCAEWDNKGVKRSWK